MKPNPAEAEDAQNPIQQSIEIHRRRITTILDQMIEKLCIGCCLQQLKEDVDNKLLTTPEYSTILKIGRDEKKPFASGTLRSASKSKKMVQDRSASRTQQKQNNSDCTTRESLTSEMVATLHLNPEVMKAVNELMADMSPAERQFIDVIKKFKVCVLELLNTSASAERAYNKLIGQAYVNNEKYKIRNMEMEKFHCSKMHDYTTKINEMNAKISDYKQKILQSNDVCLADLHRIVNEAEKSMSKTTQASADEQEILGEQAKNITTQYQTLLEDHLRHEKDLRVNRYKIETVLAGWLAKFDQDIGAIQEELEEQQNAYNAEKAAYDDLSERAEIQRIEYEQLMTEKAEVEQAEFDRRRYLFIANRSARIIQRWWRIIYKKFFKKKKPKKGRKKNK